MRAYGRIDGTVDPLMATSNINANVGAMTRIDWVALVFITYIIGLTCAGEIKVGSHPLIVPEAVPIDSSQFTLRLLLTLA